MNDKEEKEQMNANEKPSAKLSFREMTEASVAGCYGVIVAISFAFIALLYLVAFVCAIPWFVIFSMILGCKQESDQIVAVWTNACWAFRKIEEIACSPSVTTVKHDEKPSKTKEKRKPIGFHP